jgi:hypothetical protein
VIGGFPNNVLKNGNAQIVLLHNNQIGVQTDNYVFFWIRTDLGLDNKQTSIFLAFFEWT